MSKKISQYIMILMAMLSLSVPAWSAPRDKQAMLQSARQALMSMAAGGHRFNASSPLVESRTTSAYTLYETRDGDFAMIACRQSWQWVTANHRLQHSPIQDLSGSVTVLSKCQASSPVETRFSRPPCLIQPNIRPKWMP